MCIYASAFLQNIQCPIQLGYIKGKSAIAIPRNFRGKQRNFNGEHFWARGYFVSTVGLDEMVVREYIRDQERNDAHRDQLMLGV
jgi:putative transposase